SLFEAHLRLEAEGFGGAAGGGDDVADVAGTPAAAYLGAGSVGAEGGGQGFGHVEHGVRSAAGDVVGPRADVSGEGEDVGPGDVGDVDEIPRLAPVFEDDRRPPGGEGAAEDRGHTGVRRVPRHPGAVHVVIAQRHHGGARRPAPQAAEVFLV